MIPNINNLLETWIMRHLINEGRIQTDLSKLETITSFKRPKRIKSSMSFFGICNYFRKFIKNYTNKVLEEVFGRNNKALKVKRFRTL